jgi:hypothetical protein
MVAGQNVRLAARNWRRAGPALFEEPATGLTGEFPDFDR